MTIVTEEFKDLADAVAQLCSYPELPMVVIPHPFLSLPVDEIRAIAASRADEIFAHLARGEEATTLPTPGRAET